MNMNRSHCLLIMVLLVFMPGLVLAQDVVKSLPHAGVDNLGSPVSKDTLSENRGGYAISFNEQNLKADLSDNQAFNSFNGNNVVADHAFANATGVPTVIQNSGNNVIIQNATILNVSIH